MIKYKNLLCIFIGLCLMTFTGCSPSLNAQRGYITYKVFDSLEQELAKACSYTRHGDSATFIMFDACDYFGMREEYNASSYFYRVSVFYGKPGWKIDSMMKTTIRKISLLEKQYPVYFCNVDDVFTENRVMRNYKRNYSDDAFISYYQKEICYVDMKTKKIWLTLKKNDYWRDSL